MNIVVADIPLYRMSATLPQRRGARDLIRAHGRGRRHRVCAPCLGIIGHPSYVMYDTFRGRRPLAS